MRIRLSIKHVRSSLKLRNLKLLAHKRVIRPDGIGTRLKVRYECLKCGDIERSQYHSNIACVQCGIQKRSKSKTFSQKRINKWFIDNGMKVLSRYKGCYKSLRVKGINCGHEWATNYDRAKYSHGRCPRCAQLKTGLSNRLSKDEVKSRLNKINFKLVSKFETVRSIIKIKCKRCGCIRTGKLKDLLGYGCRECNKGIFERRIVTLAKKAIKGKYKFQKQFYGLVGKNNCPLKFDAAFKVQKGQIICIEAQGPQHYDKDHWWHERAKIGRKASWIALKENDKRKKEYCKKHGILLLCVPYYARKDQIKSKLKKLLST